MRNPPPQQEGCSAKGNSHLFHCAPDTVFFNLFLNLQLPDFCHKRHQVRECLGQREVSHHHRKSKLPGRSCWTLGGRGVFPGKPRSVAEDLPGPGLWPTSWSQMTEPLSLSSGDSLFWPHRDRTASEIWTLNLYMPPCGPFDGPLLFLCSNLQLTAVKVHGPFRDPRGPPAPRESGRAAEWSSEGRAQPARVGTCTGGSSVVERCGFFN